MATGFKDAGERIESDYDDRLNRREPTGPDFVRGAEESPKTPNNDTSGAEKNLYKPSQNDRGSVRGAQRAALGEAWKAAKSPTAVGKAFEVGKMLIGHKRGQTGIIVFSMLILLLVAGGILLLSPWKIASIVGGFGSIASSRVEHIFGKRAEKMVLRVVMSSTTNNGGDPIITGKGLLHDVYANFKTTRFESRLADMGMKFEKSGNGIKVYKRVNLAWEAVDGGKVFSDVTQLHKILTTDKAASKVLWKATREVYPAYRLFARAKMVSWLRLKYGIKRFGIPEEEMKKAKPADVADNVARELQSTEIDRGVTQVIKNVTDLDKAVDPGNAKEAAPSTVANDVAKAGEEAKAAAEKAGAKAVEKLTLKGALKFAMKAIAFVGWIDLAADINHLILVIVNGSEGDKDIFAEFQASIVMAQYAGVYLEWEGYATQQKLGKLSAEYGQELQKRLTNAEQAVMSICANNPGPSCFTQGEQLAVRINNGPSVVKQVLQQLQSIGIDPRNFANVLQGGIPSVIPGGMSTILEAWYHNIGSGGIIGGLTGYVTGVIGEKITALVGLLPKFITDPIVQIVSTMFQTVGDGLLNLLGLAVDTGVPGAPMVNNIAMGALSTYTTTCKEMLKCDKLTAAEDREQSRAIALENRNNLRSQGLMYALFSIDNPTSFTNRLAQALPSRSSSPLDTMGTLSSIAFSAPTQAMNTLSTSSYAAASSMDSLQAMEGYAGVTPYSFSEEKLDSTDICKAVIDEQTVPADSDGICTTDARVAEGLRCSDIESTTCNPDQQSVEFQTGGSGATSTAAAGTPGTGTGNAIVNPDGTLSSANLATGGDTAIVGSTTCYTGTTQVGQITQSIGAKTQTVTLCALPNITSDHNDQLFASAGGGVLSAAGNQAIVAAEASQFFLALGNAYSAAHGGTKLSVGDTFRTNALQTVRNGGNTANPDVAELTGHSPHEAGFALDVHMGISGLTAKDGATCANRATINTETYDWLRNNSYKYGVYQYSVEAWHWQVGKTSDRLCATP